MRAASALIRLLCGATPLFTLGACQNGNIGDRVGTGVAHGSEIPTPAAERQPAAREGDAGLWLGNVAVPITANSAPVETTQAQAANESPQTWQVRAGDTVAATVRRWAEMAGYTPLPRFSTNEAWSLIVTQEYSGTFEDALVWLSNGFERQPVRPVAILYANRTLDLIDQRSAAVMSSLAPASDQGQQADRK
jgi:hypothetical protein